MNDKTINASKDLKTVAPSIDKDDLQFLLNILPLNHNRAMNK